MIQSDNFTLQKVKAPGLWVQEQDSWRSNQPRFRPRAWGFFFFGGNGKASNGESSTRKWIHPNSE